MDNRKILASDDALEFQLEVALKKIATLEEELNLYKQKYRDGVDMAFDQKMKQKSMTELNYDGNEDRGRYGEDESRLAN